jgi:hypothetical protein
MRRKKQMDDLFKIIIWGLIIFFFLKPFFKKPPPEKKDNTAKPKNGSQGYSNSSSKKSDPIPISSSKDEYDILKELENMFKGDIKIPEQPKAKQADPYDIYKPHEIKDKDLSLTNDPRMQQEVEDFKPIGYRPTYDEKRISNRNNIDTQRSQNKVVDAQTEAEALKFEKVIAGLNKKPARQSEFRRKIKNPRSIRDYIIFSEILGKPKALRR